MSLKLQRIKKKSQAKNRSEQPMVKRDLRDYFSIVVCVIAVAIGVLASIFLLNLI
jgi:hypothetical protein